MVAMALTRGKRPFAPSQSRTACLVCLAQAYGVGGGDLRRMADFGGASRPEIECWVAVEELFGGLLGTAEPARTLGRGLECRSGGG